jgi:hypothetical protein
MTQTTRDWAALGIVWLALEVARQGSGNNRSDRRVIGVAQIPQVTDVDKAIAAGLGAAIMAGVNGTSWRVTAQDVGRSYLENVPRTERSDEDLRERVFARLKGMRNAALGGTRTVLVYILPNGQEWRGTEGDDYEMAHAAALVEGGVDEDVATGLAARAAILVRQKLGELPTEA